MKTWQIFLQAFSNWPHPVSAAQAGALAGINGPQLAGRLAILCVRSGGLVEAPAGAYRLTEAGCAYLLEMDARDTPVNIAGILSDRDTTHIVRDALAVSPISIFSLAQRIGHRPA